MNTEYLYEDIEVPQIVSDRVEEALSLIAEGKADTKRSHKKIIYNASKMSTAAIVFLAVIIVTLGGVTAGNIVKNSFKYREQCKTTEEWLSLYYDYTNLPVNTSIYTRKFKKSEEKRLEELKVEYGEGKVSPEYKIRFVDKKTKVATDEPLAMWIEDDLLVFGLPKKEMTDEQLLEYIEYWFESDYALKVKSDVETFGGLEPYKRFEQLSDEELTEHFLLHNYCNLDANESNRKLSENEENRKRELEKMYSTGEMVPEKSPKVIFSSDEYDGEAICFCVEMGWFLRPDRDLTDEELLEELEWWYETQYCFRIHWDRVNEGGKGLVPDEYEKMSDEEKKEEIHRLIDKSNSRS